MKRFMGADSEVLPPPDEHSTKLGEEAGTGKECHVYSMIAGDLLRLAERLAPAERGQHPLRDSRIHQFDPTRDQSNQLACPAGFRRNLRDVFSAIFMIFIYYIDKAGEGGYTPAI